MPERPTPGPPGPEAGAAESDAEGTTGGPTAPLGAEGAAESDAGEEVAVAPEAAPVTAPTRRPTPERRRGFWARFLGRRRPQTVEEVEAEARKAEQEAARVERGAARALGEKPPLQFGALTPGEIREMMQDPERLPDLIENLTPEQFRQLHMEKIHGTGRMARWQEYTSGDHEIELGENGDIRRDSVKELKRRGRGVLLKALPGAALLIAGCFTAGATIPAAGAVLGSLVGSGAAEAWEALHKEKGLNHLREQIATKLYLHLSELRIYAQKYRQAKEAGNEEEAYNCLQTVVDKFHEASEKAKEIHCQFLEKRKRWDRFKGIAAAIGGAAGLAVGALGFSHFVDFDKVKDASAQGLKETHHWVRRINGAWQFMYGKGEPLPGHVAGKVAEYGGQTWHTIGPAQWGATWEITKKGLAVLGAGALGAIAQGIFRRGEKKGFEEAWQGTKEEIEERKRLLNLQMPARPESSGGAEAGAEAGVSQEQQKYIELAKSERKTLPAPDQIWFMIGEDGKPIFFRIKSIDWKTGKATIDYLGFMAPGAVGAGLKKIQENEIKDLEDILRNWTNREDYANSWVKAIKDGDIILVLAGRSKVTDRYDPSRKNRLKPGQYRFKRIGEEGDLEAELIDQTEDPDDPDRKGNRAKVSIFDLAWAGVVPKEAKREERRVAKPLAERQLWVLKDGVTLGDVPEELRAIAEHGIYINEIENPNDIENSPIHVYGVDENGRRLTEANRHIRDVSAVLLRQYFRYAETATAGGGGREQQQQRGAGGGGARNRQDGGGAGGGGERGAGGGERRT